MASRLIRSEILESRRFNELSPMAQNFFFRLMLVADDYGRFYADQTVLRNKVYPRMDSIRAADIGRWLNETEKTNPPMVRRYNVADEQFLEIASFGQSKDRMESRHPAPPWANPSRTRAAHVAPPRIMRGSAEEKRIEVKRSGENKENTTDVAKIWDKVQRTYPNFNGEVIANREFKKAIESETGKGLDLPEIAKLITGAVESYSRVVSTWPAKERKFIWTAAAFFRDGHYLDDPKTWYRGNESPADGGEMVTLRNGRQIPKSQSVYLAEYDEWVEASGAV